MELLRYKNRDTNIPKRDTKENVPDGSQRQEKKISNMCQRQDMLLGEERVAKLGHIAVGEWCPNSGNVEVIVEKGKFWQTMGFHGDGKKLLRPSEALYLLETCSLDLQFHGITMSVQEAYNVLIPKMVSMEYYQVYSYLMRLGYIIDEHNGCFDTHCDTKDQSVKKVEDWFQQMDPSAQTSKVYSSESTRSGLALANKYAKGGDYWNNSEGIFQVDEICSSIDLYQFCMKTMNTTINADDILDISRSEHDLWSCDSVSESVCYQSDFSQPEEKRSKLSHQTALGRTQVTAPIRKMKLNPHPHKCTLTKKRNLSSSCNIDDVLNYFQTSKKALYDIEDVIDIILPTVEALPKKAMKSTHDYTSWNFKEICLPNLQETVDRMQLPQSVLANMLSSQQSLLPKESQENSQQFLGTSVDELGSSRLFWDSEPNLCDLSNETQLVIGNIDAPRNWGEYKLLKKQDKEFYPLHGSPVRHLWEGEVHPLIKPSDALTTNNLLHKLQTIQNVNALLHFEESCEPEQATKVDFNIYLPESNYKKTSPGKPVFYVIVTKLEEEPPNLSTQMQLLRQARGTPLVWAVVDNGDISFYTLRDIELPIDITT
ncbi:tRNA-splicing endonuclease subunit Sen54-like [Anneissia japonica]|uniref:tRNA-splicing endonuclease subunit Sen54-like n=1 Tax=Anneissia japonica TaxID=1529436 RepID=UPI0014255DB9|nr:tRNA-splicing endonuclease subunit Sen54-like [Anneissia japonica]